MFAYCNNLPTMNSDSTGDIPIALFSVALGIIVGICIGNNVSNAIEYEESDGTSDLTPDSYTKDKKITRQEKLAYTKQQTGEDSFNANAWRFYSEYTFHEYGWYLTGWADEKDIPILSWMADKFEYADVYQTEWDDRWYVNVFTFFTGLLGF